jgi:hypothetical protein
MRGDDAARQSAAALDKALSDDSADVRISAAQLLAGYGDANAVSKSLDTLGKLAVPQTNGVLTSMSALAAIEALGVKAAPLHANIAAMQTNGTSPDARYNSYVPRLVQNIVPESKTENNKPAGKKRKKKSE